MAIAKSGLLRGLKGKAAGLVMSQTKQGTIVREYKDSITNPRTPAQQSNRAVFKAAVERASVVRDDVFLLYGTNRMPSYSKLVSMIMRNLGGKASRSFKNGILSPIPPMLNQIAANNPDYKLGVLDLSNATVRVSSSSVTFMLGVNSVNTGEVVYFGCDYAISDVNVLFVGLDSQLNFNIPLTFARIGGVSSGEKNVGYFTTPEACGLGWNYIYSFAPYAEEGSSEQSSVNYTIHHIFRSLTGDVEIPFYKPAVYEANGVNALGDYWYATVIVWSSLTDASLSKKGSVLLSSRNIYQRIRAREVTNLS